MTRIIAFYLPQFHPTKHNDEWWGKGFTEWTNVGKAKKLYPGHYQPKVPTELGYYDLRLPEVREAQAQLAKEAGVSGFCYYHYWFSYGHEELDLPFKEVVRLKKPNFPFCLCWANESWYSKFWNKDGTASKKILAEQKYLGANDNEKHFYSLIEAFRDDRYIKVNGKILFLIYNPLGFENFSEFKHQWNELAQKEGLPDFYFVGQTMRVEEIKKVLDVGFDGVNHCHRLDTLYESSAVLKWYRKFVSMIKFFVKIPFVIPYSLAIKNCVCPQDYEENVYATMMPNWDHTPRSNDGGSVLHNATPTLFKKHAADILSTAKSKTSEKQIVFLKSWNEWGEGNYMEPDIKYGRGFINALKELTSYEI